MTYGPTTSHFVPVNGATSHRHAGRGWYTNEHGKIHEFSRPELGLHKYHSPQRAYNYVLDPSTSIANVRAFVNAQGTEVINRLHRPHTRPTISGQVHALETSRQIYLAALQGAVQRGIPVSVNSNSIYGRQQQLYSDMLLKYDNSYNYLSNVKKAQTLTGAQAEQLNARDRQRQIGYQAVFNMRTH